MNTHELILIICAILVGCIIIIGGCILMASESHNDDINKSIANNTTVNIK